MGIGRARIINSRRGVLFSIIAIVIATFLTLVFSSRVETAPDYKMDLIEARINTLYDYTNSFYEFAGDASILSGYGALYGVAANISESHRYDSLFDEHFINCFLTANITKAPARACPFMNNKSISYYLDQFAYQAKKNIKISSSYSIDPNSIRVDQLTDPFGVDLSLEISLNISDVFVNMTSKRSIRVIIPIEKIPDPLFSANNYSRVIIKSRLGKAEGSWNSTDLESLYNNQEYEAYQSGVSFLNRYKGNFSHSQMGIESIMNQTNLTNYGINMNNIKNLSMVDYLFFNKTQFHCSDNELVRINSTLLSTIGLTDPNGLQLDETHRLIFGISGGNAYTKDWCP